MCILAALLSGVFMSSRVLVNGRKPRKLFQAAAHPAQLASSSSLSLLLFPHSCQAACLQSRLALATVERRVLEEQVQGLSLLATTETSVLSS